MINDFLGTYLGWLDALFTATSAICVTGLIVVDTATYFTTWGQAYLLLLIQLARLGIISFTTIIFMTTGGSPGSTKGDLAQLYTVAPFSIIHPRSSASLRVKTQRERRMSRSLSFASSVHAV